MSKPIVVLKFGSSVLDDESALPAAVLEIYRQVRQNRRVVAVVSAFGDTTDCLLQEARKLSEQPDPHSLARLLETGEARSAAVLGLALADVGLAAEIADARRVGLRTNGPVLDAEPSALDVAVFHQMLSETPVVIMPGFCGVDEQGRTTLLGRGGSDLTALFLARQLGAEQCRLLKDVDGLLRVKSDGSLDYGTRYATAHYDECLRVGGPLIQPKAVEFAARDDQQFVIARCGSTGGTLAGPQPSQFESLPVSRQPLKVALAGLGSVGLGVFRWLGKLGTDFEVTSILVNDLTRERTADVPRRLLTARWQDLFTTRPDILIEVIGGTDTAASLLAAANAQGVMVVSANKQLLALDQSLLARTVSSKASGLKASASVGGGLPALEHAALFSRDGEIVSVAGVLNGTCNYVLDRMLEGLSREAATAEAQALGLAEADPRLDISGLDCVYKLSLLASTAFGRLVLPADIECEGLEGVSPKAVQEARRQGKVLKLVAEARHQDGQTTGRVAVQALSADQPMARCRRQSNYLRLEMADRSTHEVVGLGAGCWPTTCSVLGDVMDERRRQLAPLLAVT